jgi:hypothetical protein
MFVIPSSATIVMKSYDEICADATSAAEMRLLDHFVRLLRAA